MHFTAKPYHRRTTPIMCKIDTGAEMNVLSVQDLEKVVKDPRQRQLSPPHCKITTSGGYNRDNVGSCQLNTHQKGGVREVTFKVTKVLSPPMLGCKTCSDLKLVKFNCNLAKKLESKEATNQSNHPPNNQSGDRSYTPLTKEKLMSSESSLPRPHRQ